jgi:hypothetical protein
MIRLQEKPIARGAALLFVLVGSSSCGSSAPASGQPPAGESGGATSGAAGAAISSSGGSESGAAGAAPTAGAGGTATGSGGTPASVAGGGGQPDSGGSGGLGGLGGLGASGGASNAGGTAGGFTIPTVTWPSATCQAKAADLVSKMTLQEKAAQMVMALSPTVAEVQSMAPGAVFAGGSTMLPGGYAPESWATTVDA